MKGFLSSAAANDSSDDESDQEDALSTAESWVTDNCSSGGVEEDVAMAFWLRGMADGETFVLSKQKWFYVWCDGRLPKQNQSKGSSYSMVQ